MTPLKKGQPREDDRYMWGCGLRPHSHIYPSLLIEGSFFSALIRLLKFIPAAISKRVCSLSRIWVIFSEVANILLYKV